MVLRGLQLSGVLSVTVEFFSVTLMLPVAIPPALEPVLNRTEEPVSVVVPRFDIAPPRLPETLRVNWLPMMWEIPDGWVFRPPPLIGA
jgi:hypothetical protein